jgi:hypothetical protein
VLRDGDLVGPAPVEVLEHGDVLGQLLGQMVKGEAERGNPGGGGDVGRSQARDGAVLAGDGVFVAAAEVCNVPLLERVGGYRPRPSIFGCSAPPA